MPISLDTYIETVELWKELILEVFIILIERV